MAILEAPAPETVKVPAWQAMISGRRRNVSMLVIFMFMMLHQADKMVISSLTTPIMEFFGIDEAQMGLALSGAIIVGAVFFPLWGYLYDRYARPKILALAAFLWSITTWLGAVATSFPSFVASRSSTGIDDASYPGIYSLISDYYGPNRRGRMIGMLQLTMVLGPLLGMGMATALRGGGMPWQFVFYITGGLGILTAAAILLFVKEVPRGASEGKAAGNFSWAAARGLLRKPTFLLIFLQQFIYVFPFNAISYWYFRYLETERMLSPDKVMMTVGAFGILAAVGNLVAGMLGDSAFKRWPRGRMYVSTGGVACLILFFVGALLVPFANFGLFFVLQAVGSFFSGFNFPNIIATINDVVEPEVRSTAQAGAGLASTAGSALAPMVIGVMAAGSSLHAAMLRITSIGWIGGLLVLILVLRVLPRDLLRRSEAA